ncbi:MAG TPA: DNA mismatch repair endonuclease MutL [Gemmatimonadales bacterium]|nr:DNA mismatch repair endonuclease MutL [Gemmatimonadales bacterium]
MTRRIRILPDAVADQIAAGEVVERPASVVKELAENALDAGATVVRIRAEQGGKTLIEVADDGHGMDRDDALLAIDRHATSKIQSAADLIGVSTFGFRGEALPAIASVSRFALLTATEEGTATEVTVAGGRVDGVAPAARTRGTTVTVRSLFFNTPARRKFLRSVASETRAMTDVMATLALTYPAVGFELEVDNVRRLFVPAGQEPAERLAAVWGADLAGTLVPVAHAVGGFQVDGFAQRPGDARPSGRRVQLFVNGRPFRDPFLVRAAEAGYRSAIHPGDRPSLLLNIRTAPADVDVNVHPAKLEVRFRDRLGAERAVEESIRLAIGRLTAAVPVGDWRPLPVGQASELLAPGLLDGALPLTELPDEDKAGGRGVTAAPLRQMFRSFIVYESDDAVVFVDQHSAHERVLYEEVMAHLKGSDAASQRLLLPLTVDLTDEELDAVEQHRELLERTGFAIDAFGGRSVILQAVPAPHPRFDAERCFRELVADLARGRFGGWSSALERFAATYACRAAVKAGEALAEQEMRTLLARLFGTALPPHDVHGRATIVQLPREELERRFGRR